MMLSNLSVLDIRTDSLSAALFLHCADKYEVSWQEVWRQSLCERLGLPCPRLVLVGKFMFAISFLQFIVPVCVNIRQKSLSIMEGFTYSYGEEGVEDLVCGDVVNHEDI